VTLTRSCGVDTDFWPLTGRCCPPPHLPLIIPVLTIHVDPSSNLVFSVCTLFILSIHINHLHLSDHQVSHLQLRRLNGRVQHCSRPLSIYTACLQLKHRPPTHPSEPRFPSRKLSATKASYESGNAQRKYWTHT
jgi:hypothetical protein